MQGYVASPHPHLIRAIPIPPRRQKTKSTKSIVLCRRRRGKDPGIRETPSPGCLTLAARLGTEMSCCSGHPDEEESRASQASHGSYSPAQRGSYQPDPAGTSSALLTVTLGWEIRPGPFSWCKRKRSLAETDASPGRNLCLPPHNLERKATSLLGTPAK
ncbi:unnamed protein product [Caretta caretta]